MNLWTDYNVRAPANLCHDISMFDPRVYGEAVAGILALDAGGERLMPLTAGPCSSTQARELLQKSTARQLFAGSRAPDAALAGLYFYFSCWEDAHRVAQDIVTAEGSWWHAIVHRQEPDAGNASYWFRRVGPHPAFPALRERAAAIGLDCGPRWDPFAFIEYCEKARRDPGSQFESTALAVQRTEWQILFDYCAGHAVKSSGAR